MSGGTPAGQSELSAVRQEAHQLPTWDRTVESQVYVRQKQEKNSCDSINRPAFIACPQETTAAA